MKRTLISVSALLLASTNKFTQAYDPIANADITDMVLNDEFFYDDNMQLRQLGAAPSKKPAAQVKAEAKAKAKEKKE